MKRKLKIVGLALWLIMLISPNSMAQCDAIKYKSKNIAKLANGFSYKYTFDLSKGQKNSNGKIEFTYILNKGTLYMMNVSNEKGEERNIIMELYNQDGKLVATNYDSRTGKYWPIGYACNESGIHYIRFRFKDTDKECGIAILGQRR